MEKKKTRKKETNRSRCYRISMLGMLSKSKARQSQHMIVDLGTTWAKDK